MTRRLAEDRHDRTLLSRDPDRLEIEEEPREFQ